MREITWSIVAVSHVEGVDVLAVADDRDAVGDALELGHPVGDVDDAGLRE
jgi:hypothetical protein